MKYNKLVTVILSVLFVGSCDFLELRPNELTPETFYNTEEDLRKALLGVYSPLMQEPFYGENYVVCHAGGDDLCFYQRSQTRTTMTFALANSSAPEILTFWRICYEGINRANTLLENADRVSEISEETRARFKAEAYFLRSFYYFNLVQFWGDVPLVLEATHSVEGLAVARTDKEKVYDRLISDIADNIEYLPTALEVETPERISQTAAMGILARIWLFRAGEHFRDNKPADEHTQECFRQARYWANEVYRTGIHDLADEYPQVFIDLASDKYNSTGKLESMWEIAMAGNRLNDVEYSAGKIGSTMGFGSGRDNSGDAAYSTLTGMANPGYSQLCFFSSLKLYRMYYEDDPENVDRERGDWNIAPYSYVYGDDPNDNTVLGRLYYYGLKPDGMDYTADGYPCTERTEAESANKVRAIGKFYREYETVKPKSKRYTPINFPVLRYSDVLLMLAEAENELGGPTKLAYDCINEVRERAGLNPLSGLDQDSFRQKLQDERAMELAFEGLRRWDLIRWGTFFTTMRAMSAYVEDDAWANVYKYAEAYYQVREYDVYFPIPDWELSVNKLMKQNPGW